jgi:general secretion pathway protein G
MLVVLVIVGLLAAVVGPRLFGRLDDAKVRTARLQMTSLQASVDLYRLDIGRLPTSEEGLRVLVERPADEPNWLGPYLAREALPLDPWGREYVLDADAERGQFRIVSYGSDGQPGGAGNAADISVGVQGAAAGSVASAAPEAPPQ